VLDVPAHVSDLLMLACHLEPLFLIMVTEDGSLDFHLDRNIPVPCFTGDGCPQDLDLLTHHLLARLPLLDKAQLFGQIDCSQFAPELASI
jgi:hypothetical protein